MEGIETRSSEAYEFLQSRSFPLLSFGDDLEHERLENKLSKKKKIPLFPQIIRAYDDTINENDIKKLRNLSERIACKLLLNKNLLEVKFELKKKITNLEYRYKSIMEEFSFTLEKWLLTRKKLLSTLQNSVQKFHLVERTTTGITFVSSTLEVVACVGGILQNLFHFDWSKKLPLVISVISGISITTSLLALSYSKMTLEEISKHVRDEKRFQGNLETIFRRGNWIDKAVQELFPFGIDLKLLEELADVKSWKHHLGSVIVFTNIQKDKNLIEDKNFLATVKGFVGSSAAQMWLNRMILRKLLDEISSKKENLSEKEIISGNQVFFHRAAINLYPVLLPIFISPRNTAKLRLLCSSATAIRTAMDLGENEAEEFQAMRRTSITLQEDYKKFRKMSKTLVSDYD